MKDLGTAVLVNSMESESFQDTVSSVSWIKKTCLNNDVNSNLKGKKKVLSHNFNSKKEIIRDMHRIYEKASQSSMIFSKEIDNVYK